MPGARCFNSTFDTFAFCCIDHASACGRLGLRRFRLARRVRRQSPEVPGVRVVHPLRSTHKIQGERQDICFCICLFYFYFLKDKNLARASDVRDLETVEVTIFHLKQISTGTLISFLNGMETGYGKYNNPYHNSSHAADVTQTVHYLLFQCGLMVSIAL